MDMGKWTCWKQHELRLCRKSQQWKKHLWANWAQLSKIFKRSTKLKMNRKHQRIHQLSIKILKCFNSIIMMLMTTTQIRKRHHYSTRYNMAASVIKLSMLYWTIIKIKTWHQVRLWLMKPFLQDKQMVKRCLNFRKVIKLRTLLMLELTQLPWWISWLKRKFNYRRKLHIKRSNRSWNSSI